MSKIQKLQRRIAGFTINMLMLLQLNYVKKCGGQMKKMQWQQAQYPK